MNNFPDFLSISEFFLLEKMKNREDYFAHIKENKKETLCEHTNLVIKYFHKLVTQNNLNRLIDNLILKDVMKVFSKNKTELNQLIKIMFFGTVYFHDFGKINQNFQREKMQNSSFTHVNNGIKSDHSILSMYLYLAYFYKIISESDFNDDEKAYLYVISTALAHSITKHHGTLSSAYDFEVNIKLINIIEDYYNLFEGNKFIKKEYLEKLLNQTQEFKNFKFDLTDYSAIYILLKLNSSLLTASDYLATNEFMLGIDINDLGILNVELKTKIIDGVENIPYNKLVLKNLAYYNSLKFEDLQEFSNDSLNNLRQKLSSEVITNFNKNKNEKLFYIEAPTGSGKTNLSLLLISKILRTRSDITKIFYVFPFTALITQNIQEFKEKLYLDEKQLAQIHSKAPFNNNIVDDFYGSLKENYIDALFVNYPFVLLSHIKFFNAIISNDKEDNYLLHRIANSVVIIDELQSYSPTEWDKLNYLINEYSQSLNITFVLMSATLPKISQLLVDGTHDKFIKLVTNKKKYFSNPNFANRVLFNFEYLNNSSFSFSNENFANIVLNHSEEYFTRKGTVTTLIEFVTKKSAKSFFEFIENLKSFKEYNLIFIDGTVLEPRRIEIIKFLKSINGKYKIIVVATQVIEAGLDLDMDLGFKDTSILDSDEQFAGRINRNATKSFSVVYLFNSGNSHFVYGKDLRFIEQKKIKTSDLSEILKEKNFDKYYSYVFSNIINYNKGAFSVNISTFLSYLKMLKYWDARNNFKLIDSKTISVFVPLKIHQNYFSNSETEYLSKINIVIDSEQKINGAEVFNYYTSLISSKNNNNDFLQAKAEFKIITSIMSKFVFNSFSNKNFSTLLRHYGEEKYGYFFLENWENIYSFEFGLKNDLETDCNFI